MACSRPPEPTTSTFLMFLNVGCCSSNDPFKSKLFLDGFTLTQFRHSYIPNNQIAALTGWNFTLIGKQTEERTCSRII